MTAKRIYVACDVSNLWKACKQHFGENARLDFQVLSRLLPAKFYPDSVKQELVAYIVTNPKQKHTAFYTALRNYGYVVRERFMRFDKSLGKPTRTDWDVGITVDAMACMQDYDMFALMSGDGDFSQLMKHVKSYDKKTIVVTFPNSASKLLKDVADEVMLLGNDAVYFKETP